MDSAILQQVVQKADNAGVVGIKKLLSGDLTIQLKERAGKEVLGRRSAGENGPLRLQRSFQTSTLYLYMGSVSTELIQQTRRQRLRI